MSPIVVFVVILVQVTSVIPFIVSSGCPDGWIRRQTSCYFFETNPEPWHVATGYCSSLTSHLVSLESDAEFDFVAHELHKSHAYQYWTGGNDIEVEGSWVWYNTRNRVTISRWNPHEPNTFDNKDEDCMAIRVYGGIYGFNDLPCDYLAGFVCEMDSEQDLVD